VRHPRAFVGAATIALLIAIASAQPQNWNVTRWDTLNPGIIDGANHFGGITRGYGGYIFESVNLHYLSANQDLTGLCWDPNNPSSPRLYRLWNTSLLNGTGPDSSCAALYSTLHTNFYGVGSWSGTQMDICAARFNPATGAYTNAVLAQSLNQSSVGAAIRDYPAENLTRLWAAGEWNVSGQGDNFAVALFKDNGATFSVDTGVNYNNASVNQEDVATDAACPGETLYVTGYTDVNSDQALVDPNLWTMAFSKDLDVVYWQTVWPGNTLFTCLPADILVGPDGYVYVVATAHDFVTNDDDFLVVKYTPQGAFVDSLTVNVDNAGDCEVRDADIMWDGSNPGQYSIWLAGHARSTRVAVAKVSPSMDSVWAAVTQPLGQQAEGTALQCDAYSGRVFVAGRKAEGDINFCMLEYTDGPTPACTGYGIDLTRRVHTDEIDNIGLVAANSDAVYLGGIQFEGRGPVVLEFARSYDHDVGAVEIVAPAGTVDSGFAAPCSARVHNFGAFAETYDVILRIGSDHVDTAQVSGHVPGATVTVGFSDWVASGRGYVPVSCSTALAVDERRYNDRVVDSVYLRVVDVGVIDIGVPSGSYPLDTTVNPVATWRNQGNVAATFQVFMTMLDPGGSPAYSASTMVLNLPAGSQVNISSFPPATLDTAGYWVVRCSTALAGDLDPANDTMGQTFRVGVPDVGIFDILGPSGWVQPMQAVVPQAWINNYGDFVMSFYARFTISDTATGAELYRDSVFIEDLGATQYVIVDFAEWPGTSTTGDYCGICSLAVDDDVPANDVDSSFFTVSQHSQWPVGWHEVVSMPAPPSELPVKHGGWLAFDRADEFVYAAKGNKTPDFFRYEPLPDAWYPLAVIPYRLGNWPTKPPRNGAKGVTDDDRYVYATQGNNTLGFWRYDIDTDSWELLTDVPLGGFGKKVKGGTDLAYVTTDDTPYVYLLKGYRTEFYRYNVLSGGWQELADAPAGRRARWDKGSWLVAESDSGDLLYAHKAKYHELWRYSIAGDSWAELKGMPFIGASTRRKKSKDGGCGAWQDDRIYALKGGNTQEFWLYDVGADTWTELDTMPSFGTTGKKKRVKYGADLVSYGGGAFFAMKGNKTLEMWRYVEVPWPVAPAPARSGIAGAVTGPGDYGLVIAPNPAGARGATVRCALPCAGPAALTVFDAVGRVVGRRTVVADADRTATLDLGTLAPGVYLVRLAAGGFTAVRKLVVR